MKVGRASLKPTALVVGCLALLLDPAWASPGEAPRRATGVVIVEGETVSPDAVAPKLRPGDVVLSWESLPSPADDGARGGEIAGAVDWLWLVREEVPRGPMRLLGSRDGGPLVVDLRSGELALSVRPVIDAPTLERYRSAPQDVQPAAWDALAAEASAAGNWQLAWWLLAESARIHTERRDWDQATEAHRLASAVAESSPEIAPTQAALVRADGHLARAMLLARQRASDAAIEAFQEAQTAAEGGLGESLSLARVLQELGQFHAARGQIAEAQSLLERSLAVAEAVAPDSVPVGISLRALAQLHSRKGELEAAEAAVSRALAIHERLTPGSLTLAESLGVRGTVAAQRGHLQAATELMERAAAIQERLAPGSLTLSRTWNNLGIQAWLRGDLATAESYYTRSLALKETLAPEDPSLASSLNNLGVVASQRGDLAAAEGYFERALAIWEARAPNSPEIGASLTNLATVAEQRGNLDRARHYSERGLRYYEHRAPGSDEVAGALANLATSEMTRGNLEAAAGLFDRALAIASQIAPEGPRVARIQHNRGSLAARRGNLADAETHYRQALELKERLAPESLDVAETLAGLGDVAMRRGELDSAEAYFRRALSLAERWAPDSVDAAELWSALGTIERTRGENDAAVRSHSTAVAKLERQVGRLGGSETTRSTFRAKYLRSYHELIEVLLELGRGAEAFHVLERSRARGLLAMLAERELVLAQDLPAKLDAERRIHSTARDRVVSQLLGAAARGDATKAEALQARLREIEQHQAELRERIVKASPRVAALDYPQPLTLAEAQASLDSGTVLLSYSVHRERTVLFVVPATGSLRAIEVPIAEDELAALVDRFRAAIRASATRPDVRAELLAVGAELDRLLVLPAEAEIAPAERLLIIADGPLHLLPFAALLRGVEGVDSAVSQFLVARKALHLAPSVTVYDQLRRTRRATSAPGQLVAFGDPRYTVATPGIAEDDSVAPTLLRSVQERWGGFSPLPGTRAEVEEIGRIWGPSAQLYLGAQATEERAKQLGPGPRLLHFAAHGYLDEDFPLSSGLALTLRPAPAAGEDNGLLQAWEIFEQVRLDADLVTLSACDSGRGRELGGEGLIGLTRAFQYAGARTVMASLWSIADDTTTALMQRFYHYLKAGKSKDQALRHAQLDLLAGRVKVTRPGGTVVDTAPPHAWAAFGLNGDWR